MSSDPMSSDRPDADDEAAAARAERERRRRAAELLGDLLPSTTSDERDPGSGRAKGGTSAPSRRDDELMRDVPPHHGG